MDETKEIEKKLSVLSTLFILFFDKLKLNNIISQEEYNTHTKVKKEFLQRVRNNY